MEVSTLRRNNSQLTPKLSLYVDKLFLCQSLTDFVSFFEGQQTSQDLRIVVTEEYVELSASSSDVAIVKRLSYGSELIFVALSSFVVPFQYFRDLVGSFSGKEQISLSMGKLKLFLAQEGVTWEVYIKHYLDFAAIESFEEMESFKNSSFSLKGLKSILQPHLCNVSEAPSRNIFQVSQRGCLHFTSGACISTNGARMLLVDNVSSLVGAKISKLAIQTCLGQLYDDVSLLHKGCHFYNKRLYLYLFYENGKIIRVRNFDACVRDIISGIQQVESLSGVSVPGGLLLKALQRANIIALNVSLHTKGNVLYLDSEERLKEVSFSEQIPCKIKGSIPSTSIRVAEILAVLQNYYLFYRDDFSEEIKLGFRTSDSAIKITFPTNRSVTILVMPLSN